MIEIVFYILGIVLAIYVCVSVDSRASKNADFIIDVFVAIVLANSFVRPYYDPKMPLFQILALAVVGTGGLVGGVVGALLPRISNGVAVGVLSALFISIFLWTFMAIPERVIFVSGPIFFVCIGASLFIAQRYNDLAFNIKIILGGGFLFSFSVDGILVTGLDSAVRNILRGTDSGLLCTICAIGGMYILWIVFSFLVLLVHAYRRSQLFQLFNWRSHANNQYRPLKTTLPDEVPRTQPIHQKQKTFSYPDSLVTNFFDPDIVPEKLRAFWFEIIPTAQRAAVWHGFQVDNTRSQSEHIAMLLSNEQKASDIPLLGPATRIHARIFDNYKMWCNRMGSAPLFTERRPGAMHKAVIEDITVFLLVWGEAANLRHCPESLCFLFHKIMGDHLKFVSFYGVEGGAPTETNRYPGYFLDMVVTPLYDVVSAGMKTGSDHHERKTYDDFNEFFWSPSCLKYSIYDEEVNSTDGSLQYQSLGFSNEEKVSSPVHVSIALHAATKTYVEKRSWLHPLFSMRRIFEWHTVTFTLLMVLAFANQLQWNYVFYLQVASFVFLEISLLNLFWTCLEVWILYPYATISGPSIFGYLIRLLAGYLVVVYQAMYYHWSYVSDASIRLAGPGMADGHEDTIFWWWQFFWLSVISLFFYFVESILCWCPSIVSSLMTWDNDLLQAILNIYYPLSQQYIGKKCHVKQWQVWRYIAFWIPLILFKLWFGYHYIVFPVTIPSVELYDDYMNFQRISFFKTSALMCVWWFPHFLVYLIDLSIWYSVWISFAGGLVALAERQGAVRDSRTFRSYFIRSALAFSQTLVDTSSIVNQKSVDLTASTASLRELVLHPANNPAPVGQPAPRIELPKFSTRAMSTADLQTFDGIGLTSKLRKSAYQAIPDEETGIAMTQLKGTNDGMSEYLSQVGNQRWVLFARTWNEIVSKLREADHLSNDERERLLFTHFDWLSKPVYFPLFQTAGCVTSALHSYREAANDFSGESEPEKKIAVIDRFRQSIDPTTSEALYEVFELTQWTVTKLLGTIHLGDIEAIFAKVNDVSKSMFGNVNSDGLTSVVNHVSNVVNALKGLKHRKIVVTAEVRKQEEEFRKKEEVNNGRHENSNPVPVVVQKSSTLKKSISVGFLQGLDQQHAPKAMSTKQEPKFAKLQPFRPSAFTLTDIARDKIREELRNLLQALKSALIVANKGPWTREDVGRLTFILSLESGFFWNDVYASQQLDDIATDPKCHPINSKLFMLFNLRQVDADPVSPEAQRRLNFFINSLFMDLPQVPSIKFSKEYTCLTPYYSEDVLLTRGDLEQNNSDGISTLLYLKTLYKPDWLNFLERINIKDKDDEAVWSKQHIQETRMWASRRSQTLFRTVEGMMHTEAAIRLLAEIEKLDQDETELLAKLKFNYVVACQVYGQMKKSLESKAQDIDFLLARHPNLRVAYIDSIRQMRPDGAGGSSMDTAYYSVLIKYDPLDQKVKEVFRIKLPGNPVLGEGKPENQNHAIVFTRGRYLQAIDMNQEGYFEESLKMRNLLQEFDTGCSILGFREHIFTGSISSVANYMALQELSFVSLGQRVLNNPLAIRQHYGHPDLFDKLFVMTEGGMSKASKGINLSEDVFAGFNATIRGREVNFKEYVQVGKGRDVGLHQTYKFEAKLSQGNAEQSISRDVDRICDRLDFFRLMSFYYGGIGHYVSNTMVMFTLVVVVYTMLSLALYGEEGVNGRGVLPEGVFQLILAGMGVLQTFPVAVTLTVEKGFATMCGEIVYMLLSGGPLYFIFHIQTKCYYFQQTLLAGGAMYRPTGRGFVIRHSSFDENYRFFASSHIYLGFELAAALIFLALYTKSKQYGGLTWSLWMAAVAFLFGPFWFNPLTFEWDKVTEDYNKWMLWMTETGGGSAEQSWESWWKEENSFFKRLDLSWKILLLIEKCGVWSFIAFGLFGTKFWSSPDEHLKVLEVFALYLFFIFGHWVISKQEKVWSYAFRRFISLALSIFVFCMTINLFVTHLDYFRYTIATYYFGASISFIFLTFFGVSSVSYAYKLHDYIVGHALFILLGTLTVLQLGYVQTWLLYHNALSSGVVMDDILKFAKKSKESALDDKEIIASLQRQVGEQEKRLFELSSSSAAAASDNSKEISSLLGSGIRSNYGANEAVAPVSVNIHTTTAKAAVDAATKNKTVSTVAGSPPLHTTTTAILPTSVDVGRPPIKLDKKLSFDGRQNSVESVGVAGRRGDVTNILVTDKVTSTAAGPVEFVFKQPTQFPARDK